MKKLPKIFKSACKLTVWTLLDHIMPKEAFFFFDGWSHLICTIYCIYQQDLRPLLQTVLLRVKHHTEKWVTDKPKGSITIFSSSSLAWGIMQGSECYPPYYTTLLMFWGYLEITLQS